MQLAQDCKYTVTNGKQKTMGQPALLKLNTKSEAVLCEQNYYSQVSFYFLSIAIVVAI